MLIVISPPTRLFLARTNREKNRHFSPIPTKFRRNLWWQNNLTGVRPNRERQPSVRPRSQAFPGSSQRKTRDKPASAACSGPVQACSLLCTAVGMSEKCPEMPCLSCAAVVASLHNGVDANWLPLPRRCDGRSAPAQPDGGPQNQSMQRTGQVSDMLLSANVWPALDPSARSLISLVRRIGSCWCVQPSTWSQ